MAADSLLPLFYDGSTAPDDVDLSQLLNQGTLLQDDEFLSGLLENESAHSHDFLSALMGTYNPSPSSSSSDPECPTSATYGVAGSPASSAGYLSDQSALAIGSPVGGHVGYSDVPSSPAPMLEGSAGPAGVDDDWGARHLGGGGEVSIDLEGGTLLPDPENSSLSGLKMSTLRLTEEEQRLLAQEGIVLPTNMALTKTEQKHLKRVRRKIKNKLSAQESRKRKKDYVEGLEQRVQKCTEINRTLESKVCTLESENRSLLSQLKRLQALVSRTPVQTSAFVMVMVFSFSMFFIPGMQPSSFSGSSFQSPVPSRTLLFTETDEFGNIIDPETGLIVSEVGGQSPPAPLPWDQSTPAWNLWGMSGRQENSDRQYPHTEN